MDDEDRARCDRLVALLREEFGEELLGVLVTGSRVHGTPGPTSDLDAHVIIATPRRQRRNFVLDGVEVELFLNPPLQIRRYFADGRGHDPHMFAFGRAIDDPHGTVAALQAEARRIWEAGPPLEAHLAWQHRYFPADLLRDRVRSPERRWSNAEMPPRNWPRTSCGRWAVSCPSNAAPSGKRCSHSPRGRRTDHDALSAVLGGCVRRAPGDPL